MAKQCGCKVTIYRDLIVLVSDVKIALSHNKKKHNLDKCIKSGNE
jgi:hypothetical protein